MFSYKKHFYDKGRIDSGRKQGFFVNGRCNPPPPTPPPLRDSSIGNYVRRLGGEGGIGQEQEVIVRTINPWKYFVISIVNILKIFVRIFFSNIICNKEAVCSCIFTFVSSIFGIPLDKKQQNINTDELYSAHCVHIQPYCTSCQFWPI